MHRLQSNTETAAQDDSHRIAVTDRVHRPVKHNVHNFYLPSHLLSVLMKD